MVSCLEDEPSFADDYLAQARALATLVTDPALDGPLPVLLAADLNAAPSGPEVRALRCWPTPRCWRVLTLGR
jgi:hypothetical protein